MIPPLDSKTEERFEKHIDESNNVRERVTKNETNITNLTSWLNKVDNSLIANTRTNIGSNIATVACVFGIMKWFQ